MKEIINLCKKHLELWNHDNHVLCTIDKETSYFIDMIRLILNKMFSVRIVESGCEICIGEMILNE